MSAEENFPSQLSEKGLVKLKKLETRLLAIFNSGSALAKGNTAAEKLLLFLQKKGYGGKEKSCGHLSDKTLAALAHYQREAKAHSKKLSPSPKEDKPPLPVVAVGSLLGGVGVKGTVAAAVVSAKANGGVGRVPVSVGVRGMGTVAAAAAAVSAKANGRFLPRKRKQSAIAGSTTEDPARRAARAKRFAESGAHGGRQAVQDDEYESEAACETGAEDDFVAAGWPQLVGTCEALLKPYFRLTAPPDPMNVRPPYVLRQSLQHIKEMWVQNEDYAWTTDQLKSVRQDLVVQHDRTLLALEVYETHGRIALECGDLNEYNQCAAKIKDLTRVPTADEEGKRGGANTHNDDNGNKNNNGDDHQKAKSADEFRAYRLLNAMYRQNSSEISSIFLLEMNGVARNRPACRHALQVLTAMNLLDYEAFFRLYTRAPNMSAYLMDFLVGRMRKAAWARMVKAYAPTLPLHFVQVALGFSDHEDAREFATRMGAVFKVVVPSNPSSSTPRSQYASSSSNDQDDTEPPPILHIDTRASYKNSNSYNR